MTPPTSTSKVTTILQLVIIGLLVTLVVQGRQKGDDESSSVEELLEGFSDEIAASRYEISNQANRLSRILDNLQRSGIAAAGDAPVASGLHQDPFAELSNLSADAVVDRLVEVSELIDLFKSDPIQRLPVEKERERVETELRKRGDDTIAAISAAFREIPNTRLQTRLLTNLAEQIGTDDAYEFCRNVFNDEMISDGVRLVAARISLTKWPDEINTGLAKLLSSQDVPFKRLEQVIVFFRNNPYPEAVAPLCDIVTNPEYNRQLRRFAMQALSAYPEPQSIEALKRAATDATQTDLRAEALQSLNTIQGKDVLDFTHYLRDRLTADDPLHRLLDNLEQKYRDES